jgi:diguanylate cyclase (GGDEF)-like protein
VSVDNITRMFISLVTLLCLIISSHSALAADFPLNIKDLSTQKKQTPVISYYPNKTLSYFINSEMLYIEDLAHTESIDTILNANKVWKEINRNSPNFGFTATAYWFKFNINNVSNKVQPIYLELPIPFLDSLQLYQTANNHIINNYDLGDQYPFENRPIDHQNFVMPFDLLPGINEMYMRVSSEGTVEAPLTLWTPTAHAEASLDTNLIQGVWMGMIGIMVIYNFLLFLSIRDRSYLYYVFFAFGFLFFQVSLKGYGFAYLWPEQLHFNSYAISTFIALSNLSVLLMVINFLELKTRYPRIHKVMLGLAFLAGLLLIATFFAPYSFTIRATSALTIFTCSFSLILGYVALLNGYQEARYYCLAWTATFIGIGFLLLGKFGAVSSNFWTNNAGQIGVISLVSLLSFALANRINREKEMRLSAQNESLLSEKIARKSQEDLLKAQTNANNQLEVKIEERTRSMQQALEELEHANSRLELASITDSLTTLFNRGHFEHRLAIEYKRAIRHRRELSIILCDIDNFKTINDTFGHKAGDDCLRHIALILKNTITRSGDIISRFGGEEFIILLVDTTIQEATRLADTLCHSLRTTSINAKNQQTQFTASFGVSSLTQHQIDDTDMLVNHADEAMYLAKNKGRNQVCVWQPPQ